MLLHSRDTDGFKPLSSGLITKHINHTKESIQMWKCNKKTLRLMFNAHFKTRIMFIQSAVLCNMRGDNNHCLCSVFKTRDTFSVSAAVIFLRWDTVTCETMCWNGHWHKLQNPPNPMILQQLRFYSTSSNVFIFVFFTTKNNYLHCW